jgi:hypothetical protein
LKVQATVIQPKEPTMKPSLVQRLTIICLSAALVTSVTLLACTDHSAEAPPVATPHSLMDTPPMRQDSSTGLEANHDPVGNALRIKMFDLPRYALTK